MRWGWFFWLIAGVVAIIAYASLFIRPALPQEAEPVDAAIVFVVDRSDSMEEEELLLLGEGHAQAILSDEFLSAALAGNYGRIAVAVVKFGWDATTQLDWRLIDSEADIAQLASDFRATFTNDGINTVGTSIASGLMEAFTLLQTLPWQADKLVVDVAGDGRDQRNRYRNQPGLAEIRAAVIADGARINAIPIMNGRSDRGLVDFYCAEVAGGLGSFCIPAQTMADFPSRFRQKLVMELF